MYAAMLSLMLCQADGGVAAADADRFPEPPEQAKRCAGVAGEYREALREARHYASVYIPGVWGVSFSAATDWYVDATWRQECWDALENAKACRGDPGRCRVHLEKLRDLLGPENFMLGRMPAAVPHWRFTERK